MYGRRLTPAVILRFICIGFLLGIAAASWGFGSNAELSPFFVFAAIAAVAIASAVLPGFSVSARFILVLLSVGLLLFGVFRYSQTFPDGDSVAHYTGSDVRVEGTVVDAGFSERSQPLTLADAAIEGGPVEDKVQVFAPVFPEYAYGDRIVVRCTLREPEPFNGFRYDRWLAARNVYATCFSRYAPLLLDQDKGGTVIKTLHRIRRSVIRRAQKTFGEPQSSLLVGLLLGEQMFTDAWEERFLQTGTTHVVAASGYNVSVVTFLAMGMLTYIGISRPRAFALLAAAIGGYVILAGAEAAVVRAGVMGGLVLLSRQLGRSSGMANVLLVTAAVMLLFNPLLMRDDIGFGLSMLSTVALIYFAPTLERVFRFIPETFTLRESFTATLAATLFTLPLVIVSFGVVSVVSPFVNLLILPFIPYAMGFGAAALALHAVHAVLAVPVMAAAWSVLSFILFAVRSIAALPFSIVTISGLWMFVLSAAAVFIGLMLWYVFQKRAPKRS